MSKFSGKEGHNYDEKEKIACFVISSHTLLEYDTLDSIGCSGQLFVC